MISPKRGPICANHKVGGWYEAPSFCTISTGKFLAVPTGSTVYVNPDIDSQ